MIELVTRHTASSFQPNLSCRSRGLLCRHCNKWRLSSSTLELARGYGQEISISNFVVICSRCKTHYFFWSDPKFGVETFPYGACSIPRLPYGNQSNLSERVFFLLSLKWTKWKKTCSANKELFSFCSWKLGGTVERRAMYMFIFTLYYPGVEHHSLSVLRGRLVVCGGNRGLSSCISWQRPETSWTHFANLRFHTNWKLPEQWTYSLREGFTKKSCCSFGFCPNEGGGGGPCPNFLSPFHKCIFGQ